MPNSRSSLKKLIVLYMVMTTQVSLKPFHTFGVNCFASYLQRVSDLEDLKAGLNWAKDHQKKVLILGGGSNVLFTKDFDGLVLKIECKGIRVLQEDQEYVLVEAAAGENWHAFVSWCVENNYAGLENLSLIPGLVGASPIQNIGAYGVEVKDQICGLTAWDTVEKKLVEFDAAACEFGYRESVFKHRYKNRFVIFSVRFQLSKKPVFQISYGSIQQELEVMNITELNIRAIADAVIRIRRSKLPDPEKIGNAGSFFKNPEISHEMAKDLKQAFPDMPQYALQDGRYKIPAGWLIEHSYTVTGQSWKGYRQGDAGCHNKQALVLVNHGGAAGQEIVDLSTYIMESVWKRYGIALEREVNII